MKKKKSDNRILVALSIVFSVMILALIFQNKDEIVGLFVKQIEFSREINVEFSKTQNFSIVLDKAPSSLKISGRAVGMPGGTATVYLRTENASYVIANGTGTFENECVETCSVVGVGQQILIYIELTNTTFVLENLTYATAKEVVTGFAITGGELGIAEVTPIISLSTPATAMAADGYFSINWSVNVTDSTKLVSCYADNDNQGNDKLITCFENVIASRNVALNKPGGGNAVDGDVNTGLIFAVYTGEVKLDLGQVYSLNKIRLLREASPSGGDVHEITYSTDDVSYTNLDTLTNINSMEWFEKNYSTFNARYVLINTTASLSWLVWREIELYSPDINFINGSKNCDAGNWPAGKTFYVWCSAFDGADFTYAYAPGAVLIEHNFSWPMFRADVMHTAYSTSKLDNPKDYNLTWSTATSGVISASSPSISNNIVYIGSFGNVHAINASTGSVIWQYATGTYVDTSPAISSGMVYVGTDAGNTLLALNASTGTLIRTFAGVADDSSPTVLNEVIYVGSGLGANSGRIFAINALTGAEIWSYATGSAIWSSPAVSNNNVFISSEDGNVYALNASNGALIWNYYTGGGYSSPSISNDVLYVGSTSTNKIFSLNATTGALIWSFQTGGAVWSSVAILNDKVYASAFDKKLYALNASTGAQIWNYAISITANTYSSPVATGDTVITSSGDGYLFIFNATTGVQIWNYTIGNSDSSPAIANKKIYVGSNDGNVYVFNYTAVSVSPAVIIQNPVNGQLFSSTNVSLNYTATDANLDKCFYSLNNGVNITIANCANITFIASPGNNTLALYANDTVGNLGTANVNFTVIIQTTTNLFINGQQANFTAIYPTQTNATAATTIGTASLYRNGTLISNPEITTLPAGTYNYTAINPGSENYTSSTARYYITINKNQTTCTLTTSPASPQNYSTAINTQCTCTNPEATPKLYRNQNNVTTTENNISTMLPAGIHNYICNATATQNYSSAATNTLFTINKADISANLRLALNSLESNKDVNYGLQTNATGWATLVGTQDLAFNFYRNSTLIASGSYISNIGILPAGEYLYIYNTSGGQNYTAGTIQRILRVNKSATSLNLNSLPAWNVQYGIQTNVSCTANNNQSSVNLYRNGSLVNNPNTQILATGTYLFLCSSQDSQNYTSSQASNLLQVSSLASATNLFINGQQANFTAIYPTQTNATAATTIGTASLYRNNTLISNPEITTLPAGTYNYTAINPGSENYTSSTARYYITINKGSSSLNLTLNGFENNLSTSLGILANSSARLISPATGYLELYKDGILISSGNLMVSNSSAYTPGYHNITAVYPETQNYTSSAKTLFVNVTDTTPPSVSLIQPSNANEDTLVNFYVNVSDDNSVSSCILYFGGAPNMSMSIIGNTANATLTIFQPGVYEMFANCTDPSGNYNSTQKTSVTVRDITSPEVLLNYPANQTTFVSIPEAVLNCSATDNVALNNLTLYWNYTGIFRQNATHQVGGVSNSTIFNKTSLANGIYSWNCLAYDSSGNSNLAASNFVFSVAVVLDLLPPLLSHLISPRILINGTNASIFVNASDQNLDSVWAEILLPNNSLQRISLTNNALNLYLTSIPGKYNITIFANDTFNNYANVADYFIAANELAFNLTVVDFSNSGQPINLTVTYLESFVVSATGIGNISISVPNYVFDINISAYNKLLNSILRQINISAESNKILQLSLSEHTDGKIVIYGFKNNYSISNSTLTLSYASASFSSEELLSVQKCSEWNFTAQKCDGFWLQIPSIQDKARDVFIVDNITSFSGFAVHGPYCGDSVCDSAESCSSCAADCGSCQLPTQPPLGSGGIYTGRTYDINLTAYIQTKKLLKLDSLRFSYFNKTYLLKITEITQNATYISVTPGNNYKLLEKPYQIGIDTDNKPDIIVNAAREGYSSVFFGIGLINELVPAAVEEPEKVAPPQEIPVAIEKPAEINVTEKPLPKPINLFLMYGALTLLSAVVLYLFYLRYKGKIGNGKK